MDNPAPKSMTETTFYIFVRAPDDKIYASPVDKIGKIHHSTFLAGGPVKTAGEMRISNGVLLSINNSSGHYKPSAESVQTLLGQLKAMGLDTKKVKVSGSSK